MAGSKKQGGDHLGVRKMPNASERARNRASPLPVVRLYEHLSSDQKNSIGDMDLGSMLDIKCHVLHNPLISWLAPLYDSHSREFVIQGRGRIPLNADSVYRTLGLPRGDIPVVYAMDSVIEARLGPLLFPGHSSTPKITGVFTMLSEMTQYDDIFKQVWMMYLVCTLLAPTTSNKVSNRCYPILDNISNVRNMNLCQFVCDRLHDELCTGKPSGGCLFHIQLLYVDSLDISSLNLDLPDVRFVANIWSKKDVDTVLDADLKRDGSGYGNLELKPHLAINFNLFGGAASFERWVETNTAPNCPKNRKEKVTRLIGEFASGLTGLMSKLVQGLTEVDDDEVVYTAKSDKTLRSQIVASRSSANTSSPIAQSTYDRPDKIVGKSPIRRLKNVPCNQSADATDVGGDVPCKQIADVTDVGGDVLCNQSADATDVGGAITADPLNVVDSVSSPVSERTNVLAEARVVEQTRVTRSAAKAACGAKAPCQTDKVPVVNFSDSMSDGESYHSGNDSDYVDEAIADRFVIQSRRHVDGGEHGDTVLSECAGVPSQTTLSGVATVVPGVSPELVSSSVPMDIDCAVAEPSDADALVRFMETDITVSSAENRIVFQGLENLAETAAMHIDGVVDERDLDIGKQVLSETNEADLLRAKDASADGAVISVGTKSGEVLSSSLEVAVMNEGNVKGLSDGYDVVSETINEVVNDLKRSRCALDASEAKRTCVVREDSSVNPVQNEPSSAPKKKPNVRGRRQAVYKSQVATRSSPRRPLRGTSSGVADNVAVKSKVSTLKDRLEGSTKIHAAGTSTVVETGSQISSEVVSDGVVFKDAVFSSKSTSETVPTGKESAHEDPVQVSFATGSQISAVCGSDVVVPSKSTSEIVPTEKESPHEEPLEVSFATGTQVSAEGGSDVVVPSKSSIEIVPTGQESAHEEPVQVSFAPQDSGTSVTNQMADPVGDVDHHASASTGTTVVVARDAEQNATASPQDQTVTVVKRAKFVAADGKLSLTPGIPIDLSAYHVSVVNTSASDKSASPSEALGNADGHDSTISADVVKESETANVSSIPPTECVPSGQVNASIRNTFSRNKRGRKKKN